MTPIEQILVIADDLLNACLRLNVRIHPKSQRFEGLKGFPVRDEFKVSHHANPITKYVQGTLGSNSGIKLS